MSKNWGRTPVSNADKRHLTQTKYLVETDEGTEERIDRRPMGRVVKIVDPSGNVISQQLYADGDPRRAETEIRVRAEFHKKGMIEHALCPIKHGTRQYASKDFAKMPASLSVECSQDKKAMYRRDGELYAGEACPHIEWLIKYRREKAAKEYATRNARQVAAEKRDRERAKLEELQLEKMKKELMGQSQPRPRKSEAASE